MNGGWSRTAAISLVALLAQGAARADLLRATSGSSGVGNLIHVSGDMYRQTVDGLEWQFRLVDGGAMLYPHDAYQPVIPNATSGRVTIPNTLGGCPVVDICDMALYWCTNVTEFVLPDTVTNLRYSAFASCRRLERVALPASVVEIGTGVWGYCTNLSEIVVDEANPVYLSSQNCIVSREDGVLIQGPSAVRDFTTPSEAKYIDSFSCGMLNVTNIVVSEGVLAVAARAFAYCGKLKRLVFPKSIKAIGNHLLQYEQANGLEVFFKGDAPVIDDKMLQSARNQKAVDTTVYVRPGTSGWGDVPATDWKGGARLEYWLEGDAEARLAELLARPEYAAYSNARELVTLPAANGRDTIYDCLVAGLDPVDPSSEFTVTIKVEDGVPKLKCKPNLGDSRVYRTYGSSDLSTWTEVSDPATSGHRFFKVSVELP